MFRIFSTVHQIELGKFPGDHLLLEVVFQEPWDLYGATRKKHSKWKDLKQLRIQGRGPRPPPLLPNFWRPTTVTHGCWPKTAVTARFNEFSASNFKLYNKSLWNWSLGRQLIFFSSKLNVSLGNKTNCFLRNESLSVYYWPKRRSQVMILHQPDTKKQNYLSVLKERPLIELHH